MAVYKIRGRRYLKKYSAVAATPVYAAATDAQAIADNMCSVPWTAVEESHAQMSYHANEMLDRNVEIRNSFDAAAFCAYHVSGMHRAFANAACYVFELPEMETYPEIVSLKTRVVSDPYNSGGVRLAVHVADTADIPVDCAIARTGVAHVAGAVPREERTGNDKKIYWYASTAEIDIPVAVRAKKYLFLVVSLEDYSRSRGDWIEGSAYILPTIELVTSGELSGWREDSVNVEIGAREFVVHEAGAFPVIDPQERESLADIFTYWESKSWTTKNKAIHELSILGGEWYCASPRVETGDDNKLNIIPRCEKRVGSWCKDLSPGFAAGVQACYAAFKADEMWPVAKDGYVPSTFGGNSDNIGAGFYVGQDSGIVSMGRRRFLVPMVMPAGFRPKVLRLAWTNKEDSDKLNDSRILRNVWLLRGKFSAKYRDPLLVKHEFYDASASRIGDWELVASIKDVVGSTSDGVDFPIELDSHGLHTLLLTTYIDISEFDLHGNPKALGSGYENMAAIISKIGIAVQCGVFESGWDPTISLIG